MYIYLYLFIFFYKDNYYFEHDISRGEYLKFKYQKQIIILTKSIFVLITIAVLVIFAGFVYRIRIAKKLRNDEENKAFSEQLLE